MSGFPMLRTWWLIRIQQRFVDWINKISFPLDGLNVLEKMNCQTGREQITWGFVVCVLTSISYVLKCGQMDLPLCIHSLFTSCNSCIFCFACFVLIFSLAFVVVVFFPTLHIMWDLSFPTRDWTCTPCRKCRVLTIDPLGKFISFLS